MSTTNCNQMEIKTSEQLAELVARVGDESLLEQTIYQSLSESFREKLRELPPPPAGYYYRPDSPAAHAKSEGDNRGSDHALDPRTYGLS